MLDSLPLLDAASAAAEPSMIFDFTEWVFTKFDEFIAWSDDGGAVLLWVIIGAVLILTGVGLPTPEDIWLTLAGFLAYRSGFFGTDPGLEAFRLYHFGAALLFCTTCNVIGDSACWWLGKNVGMPIREKSRFFRRIITDKRYTRVRWWFRKYGGGTVFIGRQMAGVRFVTFFTAGTVGMPWTRFVMWDALGCLLSIPVWFTLGALGHIHREDLRELFQTTGHWMLLGGAVLVVGFFVYIKVFKVKKDMAHDRRKKLAAEVTAASNVENPIHLPAGAPVPQNRVGPVVATLKPSSRQKAVPGA